MNVTLWCQRLRPWTTNRWHPCVVDEWRRRGWQTSAYNSHEMYQSRVVVVVVAILFFSGIERARARFPQRGNATDDVTVVAIQVARFYDGSYATRDAKQSRQIATLISNGSRFSSARRGTF